MELSLISVLALLLALSILFDNVFRKTGLNPISGYVLAGFIVGLIVGENFDYTILDGLTYVSLLLFMLYVGLSVRTEETGLEPISIPIGLSGFAFTFIVTYATLITIGFDRSSSLLVSVLLSNTSTETVAATLDKRRVLFKYKWLVDTSFIDDIVTIVLTSILINVHAADGSLANIFLPVVKISLFLTAIYVTLKAVSKKTLFYRYISKNPVVFSTASIAFLFALAAVSKASSLTEIVGAYLAGLLISYGRRVHDPTLKTQVTVAKFIDELSVLLNSFFIPMFFAIVGLSFKFHTVSWSTLIALMIPIVVAKPLGTAPLIYRKVRSFRKAVKLGFLMNSRGALEIALLKYLIDRGVINEPFFSTIIVLTLISSITAPLMFIKED